MPEEENRGSGTIPGGLGLDIGSIAAVRRITVCIPCYNEATTVARVVAGFRAVLPAAEMVVLDNASNDNTAAVATAAGARVEQVHRKGKGNVVAWMFANLEADIYVMVDGDLTYDPAAVSGAISRLTAGNLDLVNIARIPVHGQDSRTGHQWGNRLFQWIVRRMFGEAPGDMLSGYKVFSRRLAKTFPVLSSGFEIETEIIVHVLEMRLPWQEIRAPYYARPKGSTSKLNTLSDGVRILSFIVRLFKNEHPLAFFGVTGLLFTIAGLVLGVPVVIHYFQTGFVPKFPTAFLAATLMVLALLSLAIGLVLDTVSAGRREVKRLVYALYAPPRMPSNFGRPSR